MSSQILHTWHEANRRYLTAALALLRDRIERYAAQADHQGAVNGADAGAAGGERVLQDILEENLRSAAEGLSAPSALDTLCAAFGLSEFERDLLLLCAGVELETSFAEVCRRAGGMPPTFSLALLPLCPIRTGVPLHPRHRCVVGGLSTSVPAKRSRQADCGLRSRCCTTWPVFPAWTNALPP